MENDKVQEDLQDNENQIEDRIHKQHKNYENKYELIKDKDEFKKHFSKKFKIAWLNEKGKLCLKSYILLGQDRDDEDRFVFIDVIGGKAQEEKMFKSYEEVFNQKCLVFLGYLETEEIEKILDDKIRGLDVYNIIKN